ncbi:putative F-box protein At3g21170 [Capsella rubella]|uniref:putative F-box protein At3g21170 n=1 Tax=Capsella rubella TaxID=81985 RepID=UPI000CD52B38|nr:putative F-box protein At3g21170 [Capsella rubella]
MSEMTFNDLPEDLVVEILSRVPAVSLARLRSTSKYWNALIKDGRVLAKKHFAYAPRQPRALVLIDNRVYSVKLNLQEIQNNLAPWVKVTCHFSLKDPLSNQSSKEVDIRDVFHCDGLLLCKTKDYRLVVWNPCSGETIWIQLPRCSYKEEDCYALGKSSCNKYKILRQDHLIDPSQERYVTKITWEDIINSRQDRYEHEIYDFTSNSWRGLGVTTDLFIPEEIYRGTSVNGITYWCDINKESLVSFDFSTERFRSEPIPEGESPLALSVTEQGQQLCMLSTHSTCVMETNVNLWIATKSVNTGAMSWIKFPIFQGTGLRYRHHFREWVSFFAHQKNEKYVVVSCHRTNRHSQNIIHIVVDGKFIEMGHHGA